MTKSKEVIIKEIKEHMDRPRGDYSDWYVGIASDPKERLFEDHNVDKETNGWIYRKAESSDIAREIEEYLIDVLGTDGDTGGGDETTDWVYAYKKAPHTEE